MNHTVSWVQWFEVVNPASSGWEASKLDSVCFPPLCEEASLGFVDPKDNLHGCHIIPAFAKGQHHQNGVSVLRMEMTTHCTMSAST